MIICRSRRFVFIRTRKTASTSMHSVLERHCVEGDVVVRKRLRGELVPFTMTSGKTHGPLAYARQFVPRGEWENYFKFAFVRNPWDQAVSRFWHEHTFRARPPDAPFSKIRHDFRLWLELKRKTIGIWHTLTGKRGELGVDYVGKYETLEEDFQEVCRRVGIPYTVLPRMQSDFRTNKTHYSCYYVPATRRLVAEAASSEIEEYGYFFEDRRESTGSE